MLRRTGHFITSGGSSCGRTERPPPIDQKLGMVMAAQKQSGAYTGANFHLNPQLFGHFFCMKMDKKAFSFRRLALDPLPPVALAMVRSPVIANPGSITGHHSSQCANPQGVDGRLKLYVSWRPFPPYQRPFCCPDGTCRLTLCRRYCRHR